MTSPSCWLTSLPDDMAMNCFARVSRLDLVALSMVSKRCRSLVLSPELYETRSLMGYTEEWVYVFFHTPRESTPLWFILNRVKGKSSENRLIPIPSFPTPRFSSVVAFGGGIYVIGGLIGSTKTSIVSFLDCRTHTWSYLPSMRIARANAEVGVMNGKIYVIGGCDMNSNDLSNWAEVFDPKMQTWNGANTLDSERKRGFCNMDVLQNDIYKFRAEEGMWNHDLNKKRLLYYCNHMGNIMWCDPWSKVSGGRINWKKVYGLDVMQMSFGLTSKWTWFHGKRTNIRNNGYIHGLSLPGNKLSISGENIIIFWNKYCREDRERIQIWCTEISMENRERDEVWGTIQWSEHICTIDRLPNRLRVLESVFVSV